jgi:8-oxo-dGTP pyrophosphatase MutT (NUDIX family)
MNKNQINIVFVVRAIFKIGNKYLVIKQKNASGNEYLMFPGGHKNLSETLEESLEREIKEEINISDFSIKNISFINETLTIFDRTFEIFFNCSTYKNLEKVKPKQKGFVGFEKISECLLYTKNQLLKCDNFFPIDFFDGKKYKYHEIDVEEYKKRFGIDRNIKKLLKT